MNDNENTENPTPAADAESPSTPADRRPLGYWLRALDGLLTSEFATVFQSEGITRRDWMLLNLLAGTVDAPETADRLARKSKHLRRLEHLGWVEESGDGTWMLTDTGREAHERLGAAVSGIRSRVAGAVPAEDYATTMATLEAIARELGWDERRTSGGRGLGRGRRFAGRGGFGAGAPSGLDHGFGPRHGMSRGEAWASGADENGCRGHGPHGHHGHGHHGHGHGHGNHGHGHGHGNHGHHRGERAYERGFGAGFRRGQDAGAT